MGCGFYKAQHAIDTDTWLPSVTQKGTVIQKTVTHIRLIHTFFLLTDYIAFCSTQSVSVYINTWFIQQKIDCDNVDLWHSLQWIIRSKIERTFFRGHDPVSGKNNANFCLHSWCFLCNVGLYLASIILEIFNSHYYNNGLSIQNAKLATTVACSFQFLDV